MVAISRMWRTTCTAVRSAREGFLIDSVVLPDELEALPEVLEQAAMPVSALLVTHADWDHLLGRLAFPDLSLGCAETTAARLRAEPGAAARDLRRFDEEHYLDRPRPLALGGVQALPVPGRLSLGGSCELELYPTNGHTADGMAIWIPFAETLVCGDYLSPVEIPTISEGGSISAYAATLERLRPLVARANTVIPGHGEPMDRDAALGVLAQDAAYLGALASDGAEAKLPPGRRSDAQRCIHRGNVKRAS